MVPSRELGDQLYRDKVLAARSMSIEQRLLAGPRLFAFACRATTAGIRNQYPEASEDEVRGMLAARLALAQRLEQRA